MCPKGSGKKPSRIFDAMADGRIRGAAPDAIQPEFWNALCQKRRRGELSPKETRSIWDEFAEDPVSLYKPEGLMPRATGIADFGVIIYDALFISLAEAIDTIVATADDRLLRALKQTPFAALARHTGNVDEFVKTV